MPPKTSIQQAIEDDHYYMGSDAQKAAWASADAARDQANLQDARNIIGGMIDATDPALLARLMDATGHNVFCFKNDPATMRAYARIVLEQRLISA